MNIKISKDQKNKFSFQKEQIVCLRKKNSRESRRRTKKKIQTLIITFFPLHNSRKKKHLRQAQPGRREPKRQTLK